MKRSIHRQLLEAAERILTDGRRHEERAIGWALTQREQARHTHWLSLSRAERASALPSHAELFVSPHPQPRRIPLETV